MRWSEDRLKAYVDIASGSCEVRKRFWNLYRSGKIAEAMTLLESNCSHQFSLSLVKELLNGR